jgi:tetratricopeptide (TPR) repeat protein
MRTRVARIFIFTFLCIAGFGIAVAQESARLETLEQYTRLQLPALGGTTFHVLTGKPGEAILVLDRVASGALEGVASWSDSRIESVQVKQTGLDRAEITVHFRDPATETFAYLQGGKVVLDVWKQKAGAQARGNGTARSPASVAPEAGESAAARKTAKATKAKKAARAPVSTENRKSPQTGEGGSSGVITVEPLRVEHDLFKKIILPMPELKMAATGGSIEIPPKLDLENHWKLSEGDKGTEEGQAWEFIKKLFEVKKYGLCLKSIEIARQQHPRMKNAEEVTFLEALTYKALGESSKTEFLVTKAEHILQELAARHDEEGKPLPFQQPIELYFAEKEYLEGNWLLTIQHFEPIAARTKLQDPSYPYIQILLAESYVKVNQMRRAERIYRFLAEKFPKHILGKEAYFRIADLLAQEKNYARVDEEGEAALKAYPEYEKIRAEVLFQVGEANFWLKRYDRAEKFFRRFVEVASAETHASFGWVRLGEIQEVLHKNLSAAREDYLRAKNSYPFSSGDLVATVRMARIDLPVEKDPTFVVKTLREMLASRSVDWELKRMAELTLSDYLVLSGDVDAAIAIDVAGMNQTDGQLNALYKQRYADALYAKLAKMNKEKQFSAALALYNEYRRWVEFHGPESYRAVADTYRGLGLFASANKYMDLYKAQRVKGRQPASASSDAALAKVKAENSYARGAYNEVLAELDGFTDSGSLHMLAMAEFHLGHKKEAYRYADRALAAADEGKGQLKDAAIDDLYEVVIDRDTVEKDFARMEKDTAACRELREKPGERIEFGMGDSLWYQKRHQEAIKAYRAALAEFPKSQRADRAKYNIGMSLVSMGKRDEAVKQLTEVRESGQSVWAESARQELELIEWEKKYSSVLRNLPPTGLGITN